MDASWILLWSKLDPFQEVSHQEIHPRKIQGMLWGPHDSLGCHLGMSVAPDNSQGSHQESARSSHTFGTEIQGKEAVGYPVSMWDLYWSHSGLISHWDEL